MSVALRNPEETLFPVKGLRIKLLSTNFVLTKKLGSGSSSEVWLAETQEGTSK